MNNSGLCVKSPFFGLHHMYFLTSAVFLEFTDHQRNVFCVFSGEGVNRLRDYLNDYPTATYDPEGTMYDDRDGEDGETDQTVEMAGMMNATGLGADDEDMEDDVDGADGSQYEGEVDR